MANTFLSGWPPVENSDGRKKYTLSLWLKRAGLGQMAIYSAGTSGVGGSRETTILFTDTNHLQLDEYNGSGMDSRIVTKRLFKDETAWYHFVFITDTNNATANLRKRLFVNGVELTNANGDFSTNDEASSAYGGAWNNGPGTGYSGSIPSNIGAKSWNTSNRFGGYMAQIVMASEQVYEASTFGSFDATTGEWKPKSDGEIRSAVTFGTNGFLLPFSNTSYLGYDYNTADRSGTNADWTLEGDGLQSQDNPSNNFPLVSTYWMPHNDPLFYVSEAGLYAQSQTSASTYFGGGATLGLAKGKWYWETEGGLAWNGGAIGVFSDPQNSAENDRTCGYNTYDWSYRSDGQVESNNTTQDSGMGTYTDGDVIGTYLDLDNNKIYWAKNGTIINSGTGWTITAAASTTHGFYWPGQGDIAGSGGSYFALNFGNGWFKVTKLTGTTYNDAQGQGIFKYSPNDGGASSFDGSAKDFLAICTKNLKSYGG